MIYYRMALYLLALNVTLSFVTTIPLDSMGNDLQDMPFNVNQDNNWNVTADFNQWNASSQNLGVNNLGFGDIPGGFINFVGALADATVLLPLFLAEWGLPTSLITVFTTLVWMTYGAGAIQLWTGRNPER